MKVEHIWFQALSADNEYHNKNRARKPDKMYWEDKFGAGNLYGLTPTPGVYKASNLLYNINGSSFEKYKITCNIPLEMREFL